MKKLKIAHIVTGLRQGGGETMLARLVARMDRDLFTNQVIALTDSGEPGEEIEAAGISLRVLGLCGSKPWRWLQLLRWLREFRPDLVQTWLYHGDILGGLAARLTGTGPVSWGIHHGNLDPDYNRPGILRLAQVGARLADWIPEKIVCCSESARQVHAARGYPIDKMIVIPNGFDTERFFPDPSAPAAVRRELGFSDKALLIGLFARFHPLKDHRTFIAAAGVLARSCPTARFLLCGEGVDWQNQKLVEWLREAGISESSCLLGRRDDVPRLLAALDIFVLSSRGEAMPLVLGEAMSCGVPCVSTDAGDSAELLGSTGRIVPPGDHAALGDAMAELAALPADERRCLGLSARRRIEAGFSIGASVSRYQEHFLELAGQADAGKSR